MVKPHVKAELAFMKRNKAPESMIKAEKAEHGLAGGGSSGGGSAGSPGKSRFVGNGSFNFGKPKAKFAEGGGVREGENENIDYGTRARALAAMAGTDPTAGEALDSAAQAAADRMGSDVKPVAKPKRRKKPVAAAAAASAEPPYSNEGRNAPAPFEKKHKVLGPASEQRGLGYAKGGSIDGIAQRGKTRAKRV